MGFNSAFKGLMSEVTLLLTYSLHGPESSLNS